MGRARSCALLRFLKSATHKADLTNANQQFPHIPPNIMIANYEDKERPGIDPRTRPDRDR